VKILLAAIKKAWHWLTSMRTALALMFLLALGAAPGALLPQRSLNEDNVTEYLKNNGKIAEIYNPNGKTESAEAGEVLTVVLDTDIDISRGNNIVSADSAIVPEQQFQAALCWFDDIPLNLRRKYLLKHTTQTTPVKISEIAYVWDVNTLSRVESAETLKLNDIGSVSFKTQQPLAAAAYEDNHAQGAFILIDEATNHTVAAGMIRKVSETNSFEI